MSLNNINKTILDQNGKTSSKRVWGSILIGSGLFFGAAIVIVNFFYKTNIPDAIEAFKTILYCGCVLLGATTLEFFGKKND